MVKTKKTIYTLNVDGYAPEITELTRPLLERYAKKIEAEIFTITERKHPDKPPVFEKMQIYDLSYEHQNDWNIYIDSDALIHPDMFDVTEFLTKDTVCHNGNDMANNRWRYDDYFRRDGRHIGSCNWLTFASDLCRDLWYPLDITYEQALQNIFPIQTELNTVITRDHLIDDYMLSRNIARFGLKFKSVGQIIKDIGDSGEYFWHLYTLSTADKVREMLTVISNWAVSDYKDPRIQGWMSINELTWLYLMSKKMYSVVEIGSWKGKGSHAILSGGATAVTLVDHFRGGVGEELSNHRAVGREVEMMLRNNLASFKNYELFRADSVAVADKFSDRSVDMVFIDGSHDWQSVRNDIEAWLPKCRKVICGHDYNIQSVMDAVNSFHFSPLRTIGSIWYVELDVE